MRLVAALWLLAGTARAEDVIQRNTNVIPKYQTVVHARPKRDAPQLVITARELAERGVDNLAEALERIPEVQVRAGGRGDVRVDLRGAKQRSVLVLIDGVPVDEPYFGAFDLSSIPVTDIVEVRVTLSPASPLEGPGGDGGMVEVQTLRASGGRRIDARLRGSTAREGQGAITGRGELGRGLALRGSAGARAGAPVFHAVDADGRAGQFVDAAYQAHSALRVEFARPGLRVIGDAFYQHRDFFVPPSSDAGADLQHVRGENSLRAVLGVDWERGPWRVAAGAYAMWLSRAADFYEDWTRRRYLLTEHLDAWRSGTALHLDRAWRRGELSTRLSARISYDHDGATVATTGRAPIEAMAGLAEAALGTRLEWRWLTVETALGAALPVSQPELAWPEAKLLVAMRPHRAVDVMLTGASKGRVPTLRESFARDGNPEVRPEQTRFGEIAVAVRPLRGISLRAAAYVRRTDGLIRLDPVKLDKVVNLDEVTVRGVEARFEIAPWRVAGAGLVYQHAYASSPTLGTWAVDNFPRDRLDAWVWIAGGTAGGTLRVRWVGERRDLQFTLGDYAVVDLSAWVKPRPWLRFTARVDNLGGDRYELRRGVRSVGTVALFSLEGTWE